MSRKHFVALARALADAHAPRELVESIAAVCAQLNPRFDREKFLRAAGVLA